MDSNEEIITTEEETVLADPIEEEADTDSEDPLDAYRKLSDEEKLQLTAYYQEEAARVAEELEKVKSHNIRATKEAQKVPILQKELQEYKKSHLVDDENTFNNMEDKEVMQKIIADKKRADAINDFVKNDEDLALNSEDFMSFARDFQDKNASLETVKQLFSLSRNEQREETITPLHVTEGVGREPTVRQLTPQQVRDMMENDRISYDKMLREGNFEIVGE